MRCILPFAAGRYWCRASVKKWNMCMPGRELIFRSKTPSSYCLFSISVIASQAGLNVFDCLQTPKVLPLMCNVNHTLKHSLCCCFIFVLFLDLVFLFVFFPHWLRQNIFLTIERKVKLTKFGIL